MYIAQTTFIDPFTGECIMCGSAYKNKSKDAIKYLIDNELIAKQTDNAKDNEDDQS